MHGVDEDIKKIHKQYLSLYNNGEWQYLRNGVDPKAFSPMKNLLIVGGLKLSPEAMQHDNVNMNSHPFELDPK